MVVHNYPIRKEYERKGILSLIARFFNLWNNGIQILGVRTTTQPVRCWWGGGGGADLEVSTRVIFTVHDGHGFYILPLFAFILALVKKIYILCLSFLYHYIIINFDLVRNVLRMFWVKSNGGDGNTAAPPPSSPPSPRPMDPFPLNPPRPLFSLALSKPRIPPNISDGPRRSKLCWDSVVLLLSIVSLERYTCRDESAHKLLVSCSVSCDHQSLGWNGGRSAPPCSLSLPPSLLPAWLLWMKRVVVCSVG